MKNTRRRRTSPARTTTRSPDATPHAAPGWREVARLALLVALELLHLLR